MFTCKCKTWSIRNCRRMARCTLPQLHFVNWNDSSCIVSTIPFCVLAETNCCSFHYVGAALTHYMETYIVVSVHSIHGWCKIQIQPEGCGVCSLSIWLCHSFHFSCFICFFFSTFYLLSFYEHTTNPPTADLWCVCVCLCVHTFGSIARYQHRPVCMYHFPIDLPANTT